MKNLFLSGLTSVFLLTACNSTGNETPAPNTEHEEHHHEEGQHKHSYSCPMHPEVTSEEEGACSKCGMDLVHTDAPVNSKKYKIELSGNTNLEAGKAATLSFKPIDPENPQLAVPLDLLHEKKMHLMIVSKDMSYFDHIHPEYNENGTYIIDVLSKEQNYKKGKGKNETKFENGGDYTLFVDYMPSGGSGQLEKLDVHVNGKDTPPIKFNKEQLQSKPDGFDVSLLSESNTFSTEGMTHLTAVIKKDNKEIPADQLDNYLGAKAHMVVLGVEDFSYLHVHPEVENGRLDLHTTFNKKGMYRGWLQFQFKGELHTADFVIKVQ